MCVCLDWSRVQICFPAFRLPGVAADSVSRCLCGGGAGRSAVSCCYKLTGLIPTAAVCVLSKCLWARHWGKVMWLSSKHVTALRCSFKIKICNSLNHKIIILWWENKIFYYYYRCYFSFCYRSVKVMTLGVTSPAGSSSVLIGCMFPLQSDWLELFTQKVQENKSQEDGSQSEVKTHTAVSVTASKCARALRLFPGRTEC